jgi:hypothetical protein
VGKSPQIGRIGGFQEGAVGGQLPHLMAAAVGDLPARPSMSQIADWVAGTPSRPGRKSGRRGCNAERVVSSLAPAELAIGAAFHHEPMA